MTAAFELRTCYLLLQLFPVGEPPCVDFELLDVVPEVGHVLSGECFI